MHNASSFTNNNWLSKCYGEFVSRKESLTRKGDKVRFLSSDIFLPERRDLSLLAADEQLQGTVVEFSDSGSNVQVFAIVHVVKKQSVVVPIDKLELVTQEPE
jgi:hypothetical protein